MSRYYSRILLSAYLFCAHVYAETEVSSLPDPLTLEAALELIDSKHPQLALIEADKRIAESDLSAVESGNDLSVKLSAQARWIDPPEISPDQSDEDHRLSLYINKTLYDFGRSEASVQSALHNVESRELLYLDARQQKYINVMKKYFAVLLADYDFYRYNEEMAVVFIRLDRLRDRRELGMVSDLDVAKQNVEYQRIFRLRTHSESQQRVTRSLLAQALNRPDNLPPNLVKPKLEHIKRKLPEVEELQQIAMKNNLRLKALRAEVNSTKQQVELARSSNSPTLSAQIETHAYERELSSSDKWRAGITLDVPLWSGGQTDALIAKNKARFYKAEEKLQLAEMQIKQQILELRLKLDALKIQKTEMEGLMEYRELYLDRSRALYEMEVKTDLGDSMVQFTEAEKQVMATDFDIALTWSKLDALTGKLLGTTK